MKLGARVWGLVVVVVVVVGCGGPVWAQSAGTPGATATAVPTATVTPAATIAAAIAGTAVHESTATNIRDMLVIVVIMPLALSLIWFVTERLLSLFIKKSSKSQSYSQRLTSLLKNLTEASSQVDSILTELAKVAGEREKAVQDLEIVLKKLEEEATTKQKKIQELKDIPIPIADYFAELVDRGEKRSALRDYLLFLAGAVMSIVLSLILD